MRYFIGSLCTLLMVVAIPSRAQQLDDSQSAGSIPEGIYTDEVENDTSSVINRFHLNYFGIFYGPSVKKPSSFQPAANGDPDRERPLIFKNFLNLGYSLNDNMAVTGTAFWLWQPVMGHQFQLEDPFLRVSHNSIFSTDRLNLYADARVHFGVSSLSRENDRLYGLQTVQVLTYGVGENQDVVLGLFGSARYNVFGSQGFGNDFEFYIAPNVTYQFAPTLAMTLLYELQTSHIFGERPFDMNTDEVDLEPGISWDVTQNLMLNPYLHIPVSNKMNTNSVSFGMMMNWTLL